MFANASVDLASCQTREPCKLAPRQLRTPHERLGMVTVELAVILIVIGFLVIGMIETSRGFMAKESLSTASRQGCRRAINLTATNDDVKADVKAILTESGYDGTKADIKIYVNDTEGDVSTAVRNDRIGVKVSLPAAYVFWSTKVYYSAANVTSEKTVMMRH